MSMGTLWQRLPPIDPATLLNGESHCRWHDATAIGYCEYVKKRVFHRLVFGVSVVAVVLSITSLAIAANLRVFSGSTNPRPVGDLSPVLDVPLATASAAPAPQKHKTKP